MIAGYAGKIAFIDLSTRNVRVESTSEYSEWIGGRSLGVFLLARQPELFQDGLANQPIVVSMGPLVASPVSMGVRTAISARNLQSGGICYSNVGGDFGPYARMAGFDALVINGVSPVPVYLLLESGAVKFMDAQGIWGFTMSALESNLKQVHGAQHTGLIGIGPAGERASLISCLMVGHGHAAGWGGSGAIFGLKHLKAIVASGSKAVHFHRPSRLVEKARQIVWRLNTSEAAAGLARGGTHGMAGAGGFSGLVPTGVRNIQDEFLAPQENAPLKEDAYKQWEVERAGCLGCGIRCLHRYEMDSEMYGRLESDGMHANSVRGLGSNLGVSLPEDLLALHTLCNETGLDVDGVSAALAFALECADNHILERNQPGGIHLDWGDGPSLFRLTRQIAYGGGLGDLLALGVANAARQIGKGAEQHAVAIKGVGINEQGIRSHRAWALGVITSTRGGGHLGGSAQTENRRISPEVGERLLGNRSAGDPASYQGKGKLSAYTEGVKAIIDSLGLCYFVYGWYDLSLGNPDELAELLYLATGTRLTGKELHWRGLRCHTLERYLSYRLAGYDRKDDQVPDRFYDTPVSSGPYQGAHLDRNQVDSMLDEYYASLGWDISTGLPGSAALSFYQLEFLQK